MERIRTRIINIAPSDTPARMAWARVSKIPIPWWGDVDLDKLGISISAAKIKPYAPDDGMHRLARVLDVRGVCSVIFTLKTDYEEYMDSIITLTEQDHISSLQQFLQMCKEGNFLRNDTA